VETARWLGVGRETLPKLQSPVDLTLLRRFAGSSEIRPGETLWEAMKWIGDDLLAYVRNLRERLDYISRNAQFWEIPHPAGNFRILAMQRTETMPDEPSAGLGRFIQALPPEEQNIVGLVYPDRRGSGYALSRHNDHPRLDFTRIQEEPDVHFAHARGFVAKTSATDAARLMELLAQSWV
jgi:hypothetical protein